ncbi:hypothetical protein OsJ_29694 [Oryza sativa Japonica Group]|uniref:RING-type E3 ubiquitin transferase n=1 Tax=Oryza sativa subsp. japonica TaxID=39947 RepID=B9G431_ORYSJ|nr:hypothetical protein OsJ_29694 [Oryza sativa Japonica Group]
MAPARVHSNGRLLMLLLLLAVAGFAAAQPSQDNPPAGYYATNFSPSMAIVIVVLIAAFFFLGFFSIYVRHCYGGRGDYSTTPLPRSGAARSRRQRGLDQSVLATFPTMAYADVKAHKSVKGALECAVCISEFDDDETLRLLPKCSHVFHQDCIDTWLASHATCPVCRANLVDGAPAARPPRRFPRSHSTGHSLSSSAAASAGAERFTLRLPEHVLREVIAAGQLQRTTSLVAFRAGRQGSTRRGLRSGGGGGGGEGSSRAGRSVRLGQSGRWPSFLPRTFSARLPAWGSRSTRRGDGDGSSKGGRTAGSGAGAGGK